MSDKAHKEPTAAQQGTRGCRVLLVDELTTSRMVLGDFLQSLGIEVIEAADSGSALKRLGSEAIDVVITDAHLPQVNGMRLTSRLRETAEYRHLPILLTTCDDAPSAIVTGLASGADAVLVKDHRLFDRLANILACLVRAVRP